MEIKIVNGLRKITALAVLAGIVSMMSPQAILGQKSQNTFKSEQNTLDEEINYLPAQVRIDKVEPLYGYANIITAPAVADVAAFYSNLNTNAATIINGGTLTNVSRLISDDTSYTGVPNSANLSNYTLGAFVLRLVNTSTTNNINTRARSRFHNNNGGVPGTALTGFSPTGNTTYSSNTITTSTTFPTGSLPILNTTTPWVGAQFDNSVTTAPAGSSNALNDLMGMGLCSGTQDIGRSVASTLFRTTSGGSQFVDNPVGANLSGITNNMCLELREAAAPVIVSTSCPVNGRVSWTVKMMHPIALTEGVPVTGITSSMFSVTASGGGSVTGGVTATQVNSTTWTISAPIGAAAGTYGLVMTWSGLPFNTTLATTSATPGALVSPSTLGTCTNTLSAGEVSISGRVKTSAGRGIRNVTVKLVNSEGEERYALTGAFGYYRFDDLQAGESYVVSVSAKRFNFAQSSRVITPGEDLAEIDFTSVE